MTADPTTTLAVAIAHDLTDNAEVAEAIHDGRAPDVTDLAAHLLAVLAEEGWAIVRAETVEVQYGVEATLLIDGGREVQGPNAREFCEERVRRQADKTWAVDGTPLDPVLVTRTVATTPWTRR